MNSYAQEKSSSSEHTKETKSIVAKKLDEFHELLHPLVHEAYPKKDFAAIRKGLPGLVTAGIAVKKASLPKEMATKKNDFNKTSKKLVRQLTDLNKNKTKLSDEKFGEMFMEMHDTFEELMGMME